MVERYMEMLPFIEKLSRIRPVATRRGGEDLIPLMLTPTEHILLDILLEEKLAHFDSAAKGLQVQASYYPNLADARIVMDSLMARLPEDDDDGFCSHLKVEAIVDKPFEMGVLKIIEGKEATMSEAEKQAMERFKLKSKGVEGQDGAVEEANINPMLADILRAKRRRMKESYLSTYMNLEWIPPTTTDCERLFSKCKTIFTEHRQNMTPEMLELLIYHVANRSWWDIHSVAAVVNESKNPRK